MTWYLKTPQNQQRSTPNANKTGVRQAVTPKQTTAHNTRGYISALRSLTDHAPFHISHIPYPIPSHRRILHPQLITVAYISAREPVPPYAAAIAVAGSSANNSRSTSATVILWRGLGTNMSATNLSNLSR